MSGSQCRFHGWFVVFGQSLGERFHQLAFFGDRAGGAGGEARGDDLGEQGGDFRAGLGGDGFERFGAGEQAFGRGAVGSDDLVIIEQEVEIFDPVGVPSDVDAGQGQQLVGGDQHLGAVEQAQGHGAAHEDAVLG